jgi:hypothetical protein
MGNGHDWKELHAISRFLKSKRQWPHFSPYQAFLSSQRKLPIFLNIKKLKAKINSNFNSCGEIIVVGTSKLQSFSYHINVVLVVPVGSSLLAPLHTCPTYLIVQYNRCTLVTF